MSKPTDDRLRRLSEHPSLPLPTRTTFLRELGADLDGLALRFVERGMSPHEARARAMEMLVPDNRSLRAIEHVDAPRYERLRRRLGLHAVRRFERVVLLGVVSLVLVGQTATLARTGIPASDSAALTVVFALGAVLAAAITVAGFRFWVAARLDGARLILDSVAWVALATMWAASLGVLLDTIDLAATVEGGAPSSGLVVAWLGRSGTLLAWAAVLSTLGGVAWWVLRAWLTAAEQAHADALGRIAPRGPESQY